jgi:hypothetical protein
METGPQGTQPAVPDDGNAETAFEPNVARISAACIAAALFPGLGHAVLQKWDRAVVFLASICVMFYIGIQLDARLYSPDFSDLFSILKFVADAGSGLLYWIPWLRGVGPGDPAAYTFDYGNIFIYVAGLLNMLLVVDVFDIGMGRKQ